MSRSSNTPRSRTGVRIARIAGVLVLLAILVPFVGTLFFNGYIYPLNGLESFAPDQYPQAMLKAADLYGKTIGYRAEEVMSTELRDLAPLGGSYCWGIVRMEGTGENTGLEQRLWVSLKRQGGPWMRSDTNIFPDTASVSLLLDPRYELFFSPLTLPNFVKLRMEAKRLWREQKRRFREVYGSDG
ncbi:hypothetical protein [Oceanidesulfovibrio marinus]|uniref:Uncharacterized protein n=1 Tax=Oceanidesulfovibrio marinus TaxID=370038 RepID=A0A6P1ZL64_9BACT|nr:hypothetical protein [Oceanidesulfovibrio marinus]TVM36522.1 hypothetical protein DQK91_00940 [Oceanidesulfovibrio marinus]